MYHMEYEGQPLVSLGLIIGLDYKDPYINLYQVQIPFFHILQESDALKVNLSDCNLPAATTLGSPSPIFRENKLADLV
ncbi:unnamed protein product [Gongylonema pulchrum]|uniref:Peptidase A1 domain-containing protein n=1 Tax=Gongylonema pulchrum TaxID=637853 RepID=A0A183EUQ4_9BILA|nr:unnamed protein product [Gongylonema pulchrum]